MCISYKTCGKRLFDIVVSGTILLMISPILLLVALAIRIESKGSVIYFSPRVGRNYKVFRFFKFRSMYTNADKMVANMKDQSQYQVSDVEVDFKVVDEMLIADDKTYSETEFQVIKSNNVKNAFFKVENDPRITKVGRFIRRTSIDELPQLWNVLIGDMSLVGNRPLPVYEAEKLTEDEYIERFMAPAGITGLWQVTDRGKANMSIDSRKSKDVQYAREYNFFMDMKILFLTPFAAVQQVNS